MHEAGLSNRFRPSVVCLSVRHLSTVQTKISQCTLAKPDIKIGTEKKEVFVYLIATKPLEFIAYSSSFLLNIDASAIFYSLQFKYGHKYGCTRILARVHEVHLLHCTVWCKKLRTQRKERDAEGNIQQEVQAQAAKRRSESLEDARRQGDCKMPRPRKGNSYIM